MSNYIDIAGSESRLSGKVRAAVDSVRRTRDDVVTLKGVLDEAAAASDWAALSASLGWATGEANELKAQAVYNMVTSVHAVLTGADVTYLVNRLG